MLLPFEPIRELWLVALPWLCKAIVVIQDHHGAQYVPLKDLSQCFCVRPTSPSHERRLLAHPHLIPATRQFELLDGKSHWCLREELAAHWLVTVLGRSVRPELRPVVQHLRDALGWDGRHPVPLPPPTRNFTPEHAGIAMRTLDATLQSLAQQGGYVRLLS